MLAQLKSNDTALPTADNSAAPGGAGNDSGEGNYALKDFIRAQILRRWLPDLSITGARNMPVLGICGGEQLLAVALGGTLIQHIPDSVEGALDHEQKNPRNEPGHEIAVVPGTLLHRIVASTAMNVNTSHHQAVRAPGPRAPRASFIVNATAGDGVIEGIEAPHLRFCLGVQWHPEFFIDPGDRRIFDALVAACAK